MANKPYHPIPFLFLIFLIFALIGNVKSAPIDFIKKLKGCHKGNNTKEVHKLKTYLGKLGYLNEAHATGDNFDEALDTAIKTYQENFDIKPTGVIDDETISKMTTPRCGVPDIVNGTNYMQRHSKSQTSTHNSIHTVSHYSFFPNNPKWPQSKTLLTYRFESNVPTNAIAPVARAFQQWQRATRFSFSRVAANQNADLVIGFYRRSHGDGASFDGPGGTLAHAFSPTDGRFHYDGDETWSVDPIPNAFHLETVAVHEIGHLLGLGHSDVRAAIMFPSFSAGEVKTLNQDDIQGIAALYN